MTQTQLAERIGLDRTTVTNLLRVTELEEPIRALVEQRRLSLGHAKALLAAPPGPGRVQLAQEAATGEWSVRRLERAAAAAAGVGGGGVAPSAKAGLADGDDAGRSAGRVELERQLGQHLGTKVEVRPDRRPGSGKLVIEFYGLDHFDSLMRKIGFQLR